MWGRRPAGAQPCIKAQLLPAVCFSRAMAKLRQQAGRMVVLLQMLMCCYMFNCPESWPHACNCEAQLLGDQVPVWPAAPLSVRSQRSMTRPIKLLCIVEVSAGWPSE